MKRVRGFWSRHTRSIVVILLALFGLGWLMLYNLGSLTGGLSSTEIASAAAPVGWHGIFHQPLDLPLKFLRSVVFFISPDHGQFLSRLPNAIFGVLAVGFFAWLIWLWHGSRTAILTTLLFATSAWTLHVSRFASFDVLYLWAVPALLLIQVLLHRQGQRAAVWYGSLLLWGLMLYIPGLVWLVVLSVYLQRSRLLKAWRDFSSAKRRLTSLLAIIVWLPLLIIDLARPGQLMLWLGLPAHWASPLTLLKNLVGVFVHLFVRGPQYPDIWLGQAPLLDTFTLIICGLGIYFYAKNWHAARSRTISSMFAVGVILVALGGPVGLSLLVPFLYMAAAAGLAYLLHQWLKVFPINPLARGLGIGLMTLAVVASCAYNLKAYFVAWPHNEPTKAAFRYHR